MATLTPDQILRLTATMDERCEREVAEIEAVAVRSRDERAQALLAGGTVGLTDTALAELALAVDYAVVRQDIADIRDIVAARKRLAAGRYGICIDCGGDIGYARLSAYPTAKRCIGCQRAHEAAAAHGGARRAP